MKPIDHWQREVILNDTKEKFLRQIYETEENSTKQMFILS